MPQPETVDTHAAAAPIRIAHRAGNGRASLRRAFKGHVDGQVDWIETDIWWHRGNLVARHEKALWRLPILYDKWKLALTLRRPLCLPELCLSLRGGPQLLLDLKGTGQRLAQEVVETLRSLDAVDSSAVCGQRWPLLDAVRRLEPRLRIYYSFGSEQQLLALRERPVTAPGIAAASIWERLLTSSVIAELQERGIAIVAWTVNAPERARELLAAGVSGIISDRLDLLAGLETGTSSPGAQQQPG